MALYLHGVHPVDPLMNRPEEIPFCMYIDDWEIQRLTGSCPVLMVQSSRDALGIQLGDRPFRSSFRLELGMMLWIVDNNPEEVQAPNGPVIWRWPEKQRS